MEKSLKNQSFRDFEWIICSPFDPKISSAQWIKDEFEGGYWTLNRAYDSLVSASQGQYIVSWQDYIYAKPDIFERLLFQAEKTGGLVSPVGDQYDQLDEYGRPCHKILNDPRKTDAHGSFYEVNFSDIEWNVCIAPKKAIQSVRIDVEMDFLGFGMDMYQVSDKLNDIGAHFFIDQSIETYTLRHGREHEGWDALHLMRGGYEKRKQELKARGEWV